MKNAPVALFDMDGVLCDYETPMRSYLYRMRGSDEPDYMDPSIPIFCDDFHSPLSVKRRIVMQLPEFWRNLEPIGLGFQLLRAAQEEGYNVNILTKAPLYAPHAWSEKMEWCKLHLPEVPVTISQNKGLVYGKVFVDDYIENMNSWLEHRPRGMGFMPDIPANKHFFNYQVFKYHEDNIEEAIENIRQVFFQNS